MTSRQLTDLARQYFFSSECKHGERRRRGEGREEVSVTVSGDCGLWCEGTTVEHSQWTTAWRPDTPGLPAMHHCHHHCQSQSCSTCATVTRHDRLPATILPSSLPLSAIPGHVFTGSTSGRSLRKLDTQLPGIAGRSNVFALVV